MTKYVACKFREADTRTYTYTWDGEPLAPGDLVKVADNRSDGWKRVHVVSVSDEAPAFACKPILGRVTGEDIDSAVPPLDCHPDIHAAVLAARG